MNRPFLLGLAWIAAASSGCTDSAQSGASAHGLVRLDLFPNAAEPRSRDVVVTNIVDWPTELDAVQAEGARISLVPDEATASSPVLLVTAVEGSQEAPGVACVRLKGRFDPATFNKLVLSADSAQGAFVHCTFYCRGLPLLGSTNRARIETRGANSGLSKAVLELPGGSRQLSGILDELELSFDTMTGPIRLGSIEFCQQPIWAWLPAAEQGFGMVGIGTDARSSVGLSTARKLDGEVLVPRQAALRFSVGIPQPLRLGGTRPVVHVEVQGERGRPLLQRIPLDSDPAAASRWHRVRVPLDSFAGQRVRVRFAFTIGGKREAVCALTRPRLESAKPAPRTVLLVTSDTHRADAVGAMNPPVAIQTPTIDALARRGVLFEDCWSSTNVTIPSHAALMTATTPRDVGVLDNYTRLSHGAYTLAEAFQDAGFATYAVVSAPHLSDSGSGLGQGFDRMSAPLDTNKRRSAQSIEQLDSWIDDAEGQDLFLWLHLFDAHTPYQPPAEFESRYWPADRDAFDPRLPEPLVPPFYRVNLPEGLRDLELLSARYRGEVSYLDAELARLFEVPRIRDGVIALTADHGESLGEHGIFWEHAGLYPQSIHVPLVIAWPQAPAGTRIADPVSQLDLAQTLLRLADIDQPKIPGVDLFSLPAGAHAPRFTISSGADRASVTKDRWHLIVSLRGYLVTVGAKQQPYPRHHVELFDLSKDPRCEQDLARSEPERARELRLLLCSWISAAAPRGWEDRDNPSPEMANHLAQLGYTEQPSASTILPIDPDCTCAECAPFLPRR